MKKKSYAGVILSLGIVLVGVIAVSYEIVRLGQSNAIAPSSGTVSIIPGTNNQIYRDTAHGFSISYPSTVTPKHEAFEGYLPVTGQAAVGLFLPEALFAGTNLGEAALIVGVSKAPTALANCSAASNSGEEKETGIASLAGASWYTFSGVSPAAGNLYETKVYRTIRNGACYEMVELLHSGNIYNYTPGTVKEFDKATFVGILDRMAQSFVFTAAGGSGVIGKVELGPTCPVERIPPDPACAPKPYQTTIMITKSGDTSFSKQIASGADGTFQADLAPGTYQFAASGGATLPRCSPATVRVVSGQFAPLTISCDTGIR